MQALWLRLNVNQNLLHVADAAVWRLGLESVNLHVIVKELGSQSNLDGSLSLVASEDPDLNATFEQIVNSLWNVVLQLVFNGTDANKVQVPLQLIRHCHHVGISIS